MDNPIKHIYHRVFWIIYLSSFLDLPSRWSLLAGLFQMGLRLFYCLLYSNLSLSLRDLPYSLINDFLQFWHRFNYYWVFQLFFCCSIGSIAVKHAQTNQPFWDYPSCPARVSSSEWTWPKDDCSPWCQCRIYNTSLTLCLYLWLCIWNRFHSSFSKVLVMAHLDFYRKY